MTLGLALAVVGHGRHPRAGEIIPESLAEERYLLWIAISSRRLSETFRGMAGPHP